MSKRGCLAVRSPEHICFSLRNLQSGGAISSYSVAPGDQNQIWRLPGSKITGGGWGRGGEAASNKYGHEENPQF